MLSPPTAQTNRNKVLRGGTSGLVNEIKPDNSDVHLTGHSGFLSGFKHVDIRNS